MEQDNFWDYDEPSSADAWPLPDNRMFELRITLETLVEVDPGNPMTENRQYVLDHWPNVRPLF